MLQVDRHEWGMSECRSSQVHRHSDIRVASTHDTQWVTNSAFNAYVMGWASLMMSDISEYMSRVPLEPTRAYTCIHMHRLCMCRLCMFAYDIMSSWHIYSIRMPFTLELSLMMSSCVDVTDGISVWVSVDLQLPLKLSASLVLLRCLIACSATRSCV